MDLLHSCCAGLDIHKDTVVACARTTDADRVKHEVKTFCTTTRALLELADWLTNRGCTVVAMEATGVYWRPIWHLLEADFELVLANPMHIKNVPGRKSDVNDATWIADLLAHGLIRASFVPPKAIGQLRDLTRTRKQLVREIGQHTLRLQKTLDDANIRITGLVTDLLGVSGRAILRALIGGETDPERLANLRHGRLKADHRALVEALRGQVTDHHRFLLKVHLSQVEALERTVSEVEARLGEALEPFRGAADLLSTIPGVSETMARVIVAEIGVDMGRFPTAGHLISWAGLCPRMDESAGKRRSTRLRPGAPWLKTNLVQAAWAATRTKGTYLRAQFVRLKARRGPRKAIIAVAASMLTAAYHMLKNGVAYRDLGGDHFDRLDQERVKQRLVKRLEGLGLEVTVRPAA